MWPMFRGGWELHANSCPQIATFFCLLDKGPDKIQGFLFTALAIWNEDDRLELD